MTTTKTESTLSANHRDRPQWWTGPRLLKLGEQITFTFHLPEGTGAETLAIFPRYLEQADPAEQFQQLRLRSRFTPLQAARVA